VDLSAFINDPNFMNVLLGVIANTIYSLLLGEKPIGKMAQHLKSKVFGDTRARDAVAKQMWGRLYQDVDLALKAKKYQETQDGEALIELGNHFRSLIEINEEIQTEFYEILAVFKEDRLVMLEFLEEANVLQLLQVKLTEEGLMQDEARNALLESINKGIEELIGIQRQGISVQSHIIDSRRIAATPITALRFELIERTRQNEIEEVKKRLKTSLISVNCLWVTGQPGSGKTIFAFLIARSISNDGCIYIPEGVESDVIKFTEHIKQSISDEYFQILMNSGIQAPNDLPHHRLIDIAIMAINQSDKLVIVESACEPNKDSIFPKLLESVQYSRGLKLILTTYSISSKLPANHIVYELPKLSFEDASKIMLHYRPDIDNQECQLIYSRFDGHALSIDSWAKSEESTMSGLPAETVARFQERWRHLPEEARRLFSALCNEPDLAIPYLLEERNIDTLLDSGLLSRYPCVQQNGVGFYVHQIARSACRDLLPPDTQLQATIELLDYIVREDQGVTWVGPRLIDYLLKAHQVDQAGSLLLVYGRDWLESSGLRTSQEFLMDIRLKFNWESRESFFCRYLQCLAYLFSGKYRKALAHFGLLRDDAGKVSPSCSLAMGFEIVECLRRLGELSCALAHFSKIYGILEKQNFGDDNFDTYFGGMSFFLTGHLFRHFGRFRDAYRAYNLSEKCFLRNITPNNRIEALHCAYSKSQCFFIPEPEINNNISYKRLIEDTKSHFLQGLFHLTQARFYAIRSEYDGAYSEIKKAKQAFRNFGSVVYYQRSCCFEALLGEAMSDYERTRRSLTEIPEGKEASTKISILTKTMRLLNASSNELLNSLSESAIKLLQNGNTLSLFSLLCLLKIRKLDYSSINGSFQVAKMNETAENQWCIHRDVYESLIEFEDSVVQEYGIEDFQSGIFLFD